MKRTFRLMRDVQVVIPATVLETRLLRDGEIVSTIDIPEETRTEKAGATFVARNRKEATALIVRFGDAIEEIES